MTLVIVYMEPWEENDSSNTMEIGNENISNSTIESGEGSSERGFRKFVNNGS